jgi:DNA ligase-1
MVAALDYAVDAGYEGIMLRNITLPYMAGRSGESLYKLKRFFDEEFEIVGYEEATGKDSNTPVWICTTKGGKTFKARPMGTMAAREQMWRDRDKIVGKDLTVRFQEKSRDGVPRFPTGVVIRDYE